MAEVFSTYISSTVFVNSIIGEMTSRVTGKRSGKNTVNNENVACYGIPKWPTYGVQRKRRYENAKRVDAG